MHLTLSVVRNKLKICKFINALSLLWFYLVIKPMSFVLKNRIYPYDCDERYNTHYFIFNRHQMSELADASKQKQGVQVSYSIYRIYRITIPPVGKCCLSLNSLQRSSVNFKLNAVQFHPGLIVQNIQYILLMRSIDVYINLIGYIDRGRNSSAIIMPHLVDEIM